MAVWKMGAMATPNGVLTSDGKILTINGEHVEMLQFSCNRGDKSEETTADGRKTQTICKFINSALIQLQEGDGKKSTIKKKIGRREMSGGLHHKQGHLYSGL